MSLQLPLVLPPDVLIIGSSDVSPDMRAACGCGPDDFIITRPRTRVRSWTLSADSAEVLNSFRSPRTIVDVVIALARRHNSAPETVLDETLQLLRPFIEARWLVRADSDEARQIAASLRTGEVVDGFRVLSCLQLLSDTEVYQARDSCGDLVALKLVRRGASAEVERMIAHEAEILRHLDGHPAPPLLRSGTIDGQCYLAIAWRTGVRAHLAARRLRHVAGPAGGRGLLGLCRNILDAYALLHSRGVIHGDVHSSNILVDDRNGITVLDYGLAQLNGHGVARHHRGVEGFMEPEYAQASLASTSRPQCSPIGEQYALAALFYLLVTGHMYLEFSAEKDVMLRQILVERPRPFSTLR